MKVLFLDIDGVLNSHAYFQAAKRADDRRGQLAFGAEQIDPQALELLDRLVAAADCELVLSTSWRHIWPAEEIAEMMRERGFKHADRIDSETPTEGTEEWRGDEIRGWLALERERREVDPDREPITGWCILDDTPEFDTEQHEHFVQTDAQIGLTEADVQRAIQILKGDGQ